MEAVQTLNFIFLILIYIFVNQLQFPKAILELYIFCEWEYVSIISGLKGNCHNVCYESSGIS